MQYSNVYSAVLDICTDYGLTKYLNHVIRTNPSNNLPYHNLYHTLCVVRSVHELATEGMNYRQVNNVLCGTHEPPVNLTHDDVKSLLIAALYHDYGHSGGKNDESWNIRQAIASVPNEVRSPDIENLIRATEYPYKDLHPNERIEYMQMIMRDADLCQIYQDNFICQCVLGLYEEAKVMNPNLTMKEMIDKYMTFIDGTSYNVYSNHAISTFKDEVLLVLTKFRSSLSSKNAF